MKILAVVFAFASLTAFADTHTKTTTTKNDDGSMQTKKETSVDSTTHASTTAPATKTTKKTTKKSM